MRQSHSHPGNHHRRIRNYKLTLASLLLAVAPQSAVAGDFWWRGDIDNRWSSNTELFGSIVNTNFATNSGGLVDKLALPGSGDIVRFASSNGAFFNTALGTNFTITGLTTESTLTSNVNISGNTLNFDFNPTGIVTNAPRNLTINSTITSNTSTLVVNTANLDSSVNITSSMTDDFGLSKQGPGTLNLNNANSHQFNVVRGGRLVTTDPNALGINKLLTIGDGETPTAAWVRTLGNAQSVSSLNMFARSSANLTALDVGNGTFTVNGNISVLDNVASQGNAFATVIDATPGGTLSLGGAVRNIIISGQNVSQRDLTVNAVVASGGINLTANPSSTNGVAAGLLLNASAPNTYTAGTTVNAGTLTVNSTTTLGPGSLTMNTSGTVESRVILNNPSQTITRLQTQSLGTAGAFVELNGTALTVNQSVSSIFIGTLSGAGSLTKSGVGNLTLSRANSYQGGTTILGGTLTAGAANALPSGEAITIGRPNELATGVLNTGGFAQTISSLTLYARNGPSAVNIGTGTLTLTGNVTMLDTLEAPGNGSNAIIDAAPGGTLNLGGGTRSFILAGQNVLQAELVIDAVITNGTLSLTANPSSLNSNPAGMVLNATAPNTYGGGTTVNAGTLTINAQTTLGSGPLTVNTSGNVESKVVFNNPTQSVTLLRTSSLGVVTPKIELNGTALTVNQGSNSLFAGNISGEGSLIKSGAGTLTLSNTNNYLLGTTISGGALQLGNGGSAGSVIGNVTNNASLIFNRSDNFTFTDFISGTGSLTKTGPGTLTLSGPLAYTGNTSITTGKLILGSALNTTTGDILLSSNTAVEFARPRSNSPVIVSTLDNLSIPSTAIATITPSTRTGGLQQGVLIVNSLSITGTGFLDLTNNDLIVRSQSIASVRDLVATWYTADSGLPGSIGLGSSESFYTVNGAFTTLAVYDNSIAGQILATFEGIPVLPSDILVKYTYLGDTNIDGVVDASDLARLLQGMSGQGSGWNFGDVNYDGQINFTDLGRLQAALRGQAAPLSTTGSGTPGGVIPEPTSLALLPLPALLLRRLPRATSSRPRR